MNGTAWWMEPAMIDWCHLLLDSFRRWTNRDLVKRAGSRESRAQALFAASFVIVSHGIEKDPVLNYGNRAALALWETGWEQFRGTPSRLTTEPTNRTERERMLEQARTRGIIHDYRGVRISMTGRRFLVEDAVVWNIIDHDGRLHGQAATFSHWTFL